MPKEVKFDLIVIGAGSGLEISSQAAEAGWKVAVVEQGPFGGTCLNRGCIPSKMLIHVADLMKEIQESGKFGIKAKASGVNWSAMMRRVNGEVDNDAKAIEAGNREDKNITVFKGEAKFVGAKTIEVKGKRITAKNIVIAAGTRPSIPPMPGLSDVDYITSDEAMRLKKQPKKMIFIGGGYIACELAHFFQSLGTQVTLVQRSATLLSREDDALAMKFTEIFSRRVDTRLTATVNKVWKKGKTFVVEIQQGKKRSVLKGDTLVVATGRRPNTDILNVRASGVRISKAGFIDTDEYMRTNVAGIWAIGDIAGKWQFKHSANLEAEVCVNNILNPRKMVPVDYTAMPHAIFSSPQMASVGATEEDLQEQGHHYSKGEYEYKYTGYGAALMEEDGFVKVLIDPVTRKVLGCHILGPHASILIHEVIVAMKAGITADALAQTIHIHPALSEVVQRAFNTID